MGNPLKKKVHILILLTLTGCNTTLYSKIAKIRGCQAPLAPVLTQALLVLCIMILHQKDIFKGLIIIFTFEPDGIFFHLDQAVRHKNMECQALPFEVDWHDRGHY